MRHDTAFAYETELTLAQQLEWLNADGRYAWTSRDSHWYGDYQTAQAHDDYAFFKIFDDAENGRFVLNLKFVADRPTFEAELAELIAAAKAHVLPVVGAHDVTQTEPFD